MKKNIFSSILLALGIFTLATSCSQIDPITSKKSTSSSIITSSETTTSESSETSSSESSETTTSSDTSTSSETTTSSSETTTSESSETSSSESSETTTSSESTTSSEPTSIPSDDPRLALFDDFVDVRQHTNASSKLLGIADPFIYRWNGKYYLYFTCPSTSLKAYVSDDLVNWNYAGNNGVIYNGDDPAAPWEATYAYAPEVIYNDGLFYLYFRGNTDGSPFYCLTSENPDGPYKVANRLDSINIDGSIFIDGNERIYCTTAGSNCITYYSMDTLKGGLHELGHYGAASLFNMWTEGPYILERYGSKYLTYTGNHYLSDSYRVDYAYAEPGKNIDADCFVKGDHAVISNTDDFGGLGHSCTFLGPDLDSYYIGYHNIQTNARFLNYSRLSFAEKDMKADQARAGIVKDIYQPYFSAEDESYFDEESGFLISTDETSDTFSVEYNVIGCGDMVFSWLDEENYCVIRFQEDGKTIKIIEIVDGVENVIETVVMNKTYSTEVLHNFRLQHKDGKIAFYFDNIEKIPGKEISTVFTGGYMGFHIDNDFSQIGYCSFSNKAFGSSDGEAYEDVEKYAASYNEELSVLNDGSGLTTCSRGDGAARLTHKGSRYMVLGNNGDRATYNININETGTYMISLQGNVNNAGKSCQFKLDNQTPQEVTFDYKYSDFEYQNNKSDINSQIIEMNLSEGPHHFSIIDTGDSIEFFNLTFKKIETDVDTTFDFHSVPANFYARGATVFDPTIKGLYGVQPVGLLTKENYSNITATMNFRLWGGLEAKHRELSLLMNVDYFAHRMDDSVDPSAKYDNMFKGFAIRLNGNKIQFVYSDYNNTFVIKEENCYVGDGEHNLMVKQNNYHYQCYFDDQLVLEIKCNTGPLVGGVGFTSYFSDTIINSLSIKSNSLQGGNL